MNLVSSATPSLLPARETRRAAAPFLPLRRVSLRTGLWCVLLGVGVITPLALGIGLLHLPASAAASAAAQQRWLGYFNHPGALFLKAVLIVPLLEEIFYRGLVLQLLRRYCPPWFAIGLSSAFFAATHLGSGYATAVNALVLGGIFAWLVIHTRSLVSSVVCHATVNFAWLFLINPAFGVLEKIIMADSVSALAASDRLTLYPAWWLLTSLALTMAAVAMLRKDARRPTAT